TAGVAGFPKRSTTTASAPPSRWCWWITRAGSRNWRLGSPSWRERDDECRDDHGGSGAADPGGDAAAADRGRGGDQDALRARACRGADRQGEPADRRAAGAEAGRRLAAAHRRDGRLPDGSRCHAWRDDLAQLDPRERLGAGGVRLAGDLG